MNRGWDVVVAGGGNAALCAAITAREAGARVLLIEKESREWRGGNSKYTRNIRCATEAYPENELLGDLIQVTGQDLDHEMAELAIHTSREVPAWMEERGIRWQPALRGTLQLSRTNRFFLGGGKALVNTYYERARELGVEIRYQSPVEGLEPDGNGRWSLRVGGTDGFTARAAAVVVASGGFEANLAWLRRHWGDAADNFIIRGSRANDGLLLANLLDLGADQRGNPRGFHAVAVDARAPRFEGGIVTRVDSIPLGVVVNHLGSRFYDEGEDIWPKRYAVWGRLIAEQPGQIAYSIYDAKAAGKFIPPAYPAYASRTIAGLAEELGLEPSALDATIREFNGCCCKGDYDPTSLDGCHTSGLMPAKSHWALRLDSPPFYAYPLRPGITFTYLGVAVDGRARVLKRDGTVFPNVFAAGEIMAGMILRHGYLGGFGMTIGTVFGRIAGREAALSAQLD